MAATFRIRGINSFSKAATARCETKEEAIAQAIEKAKAGNLLILVKQVCYRHRTENGNWTVAIGWQGWSKKRNPQPRFVSSSNGGLEEISGEFEFLPHGRRARRITVHAQGGCVLVTDSAPGKTNKPGAALVFGDEETVSQPGLGVSRI